MPTELGKVMWEGGVCVYACARAGGGEVQACVPVHTPVHVCM